MKKNILIGCGMLILIALVWVGARNMNATAETDVSSNEEAKRNAESTDVKEPEEEETENAAEQTDDPEVEAESSEEAEEESSESGLSDAVSKIAESIKSEEGVLYVIETSAGNNLGMVPIVNGSAVVLLNGNVPTYQGDYMPEEMSAFGLKLEDEIAKASSNGKISEWAFYREAMLREFTFPQEVTAIEKFAFARSGLGSVVIPEGVTSIGYSAFYHCDALSDVTIPDSVTNIGENAFAHTPWLENWISGGGDEEAEDGAAVEAASDSDDFLIVGDGILLAYRGSEENPEIPAEVKSVVPGVFGE